MSFAASQHPLHLSQTKVTARLISMTILVMSITNVFLLSFAQAASLHSHLDSQCNHVHPKPNDVSIIFSQLGFDIYVTKQICEFDILLVVFCFYICYLKFNDLFLLVGLFMIM